MLRLLCRFLLLPLPSQLIIRLLSLNGKQLGFGNIDRFHTIWIELIIILLDVGAVYRDIIITFPHEIDVVLALFNEAYIIDILSLSPRQYNIHVFVNHTQCNVILFWAVLLACDVVLRLLQFLL